MKISEIPVDEAQRLLYIKELKREIDEIRSIIKRKNSEEKRPLIIEFCGSPRAGKTSCLSSLEIFFARNDISVKIVSEKAAACPISDKSSPSYNIWNTLQMICEVEEILSQSESSDIILLDRGLFDSLFWSFWHHSAHRMSNEEYQKFNDFITLHGWIRLVQVVFIFKCRPEVSIKREYSKLLTDQQGKIVNIENLSKYLDAIENVRSNFSDRFQRIEEIDTSDLEQNDVSFQVTKQILHSLRHLLDEHVAVVDRKYADASLINKPTSFSQFFNEELRNSFRFIPRAEAEKNADLIQLIPTMFVKDDKANEFFSAGKRNERASNAEKQKIVYQFGGHARDTDKIADQGIIDFLKNALGREVKEELGLTWRAQEDDPICIWNNDTPKSEQHLAVCFLNSVERTSFNPRLGAEFVSRGERAATWRSARDISVKETDTWSLLYMVHHLGDALELGDELRARQTSLGI
nr:hypothetical protein [uncultured Cohaesibacter sp.]